MTEFFNVALFNDAASRVNLSTVSVVRYPLKIYSPELDTLAEYETGSIRDYLRYSGEKKPVVPFSTFNSLYKRESRIGMFEEYADMINQHDIQLAVYYMETKLGEGNEIHSIPWMSCMQFKYEGYLVGNHAGSLMFPICHPTHEKENPDTCFIREEKEGLLIASTQALFQYIDGFTIRMPLRGQNMTHIIFTSPPFNASFDITSEKQIAYYFSNDPDLKEMMHHSEFRSLQYKIKHMLISNYDGAKGVQKGNISSIEFVNWGFRTHKHAFINDSALAL